MTIISQYKVEKVKREDVKTVKTEELYQNFGPSTAIEFLDIRIFAEIHGMVIHGDIKKSSIND